MIVRKYQDPTPDFILKTLGDTNLFVGGIPQQNISNKLGFAGSKVEKFLKFQKVDIWKMIFCEDDSIISLYVLRYFGDKKEV